VFNGILQFLQKGTNKAKLKQVGKNGILIVQDVKTMNDLHAFLKRMSESIPAKL
jgi:transcription-repair coupling factor (superfamily II helicase)